MTARSIFARAVILFVIASMWGAAALSEKDHCPIVNSEPVCSHEH